MKTAMGVLRRLVCPLAALVALGWCMVATAAEPAGTPPAAKESFFFIPHTHWEGAVFKTREDYLDMGLPNILRTLRLLKIRPDYRFVLDQACYVKPFLERYPEEAAAFERFVKEGRLAIVGGTDVMLDVNMPGGESFVRQVLYGKGYFRKRLGVDVTVGWQLDTFGHHAQMPQLMKLGGYKSFWFFRGVAHMNTPAEFLWEGIDGSRIHAFWLTHSYAHTYGSPTTEAAFAEFFKGRFDALAANARGSGRVGLAGADVCEPEEHVPALAEQFNRKANAPFSIRIATPTDYEKHVAARSNLPVIGGELNPIFQGVYSSRIELKQRTRELERLLTADEKLGVLLRWLGAPADDAVLWRAWEPMLFNQAHDLMSGVMTDYVYEDTIRGYDFSKRIARDEFQQRHRSLASRIDTRGEGIAVAVFNPLGWPRTDLAEAEIGFAEPGVAGVRLMGPDGKDVAVQVHDATRHGDGGILRAKIAFVARDVPSLGHAVYRALPLQGAAAKPAANDAGATALENEHYRVEFDPAGGAITRLLVKSGNWEALRGPANVVAQEADHGDLWEPYHSLDGGSRIAMKTQVVVPTKANAKLSSDQSAARGTIARGPVYGEFHVAHPLGAKNAFATTVRVYNGLRRIDIRTQLTNQDQFVRYRAVFPTSIADGKNDHEIPFGAVRRPDKIEFPAQNWVDCGNAKRGVALLNRGLPGNAASDGTLLLSLLRSTRIVAYGFGGGYEPGMSSDTGLEVGKSFTFDYALLPHDGDWRTAAVYREGWEFNHPLVATTVSTHRGVLPARWGFASVEPHNVVVSAMKPGAGGTAVVRIYEATGKATEATLRFSARVVVAEEVNLMEDPGKNLSVVDDTLRFALRPFEIKTFKLTLAPAVQ